MDIKEAPQIDDSDSDSDDESVKSEASAANATGLFPRLIAEYMQLDDELAEIRAVVREKNKRKKVVSEQLVEFYKKKDLDHVKLKNGIQLNMNEKKTTQSLSKKLVVSLLTDFLKDSDKAEKAADYIYDNRSVKYSSILKRQNGS